MRNRKIIVGIIVTLGLSGLCQGSDVASLQRENDQLRRRVARLETALADFKTAAGANSSGPDLDGLRQENEQWQQRVRKLETMIATLNETVRAQSGALEAVQTQQGASHAEHAQALQTENDRLKPRMAGIEKEVAEIGKETKATPAPDTTAPVIQATVVNTRPAKAPNAPAHDGRKGLWSTLDVQFYGYVKADASYDDSRTNPGNFVIWVDNETSNPNDDEFNLTANQTRLGFNIKGPVTETMKTSGKVEVDFFGSGGTENKPKIQGRHLYLTLDWPQDSFSILAGQTSDVISPLVPTTLNYTVLWFGGNIGYRRPQIRATKVFKKDGAKLTLQGAVARTIGRTDGIGSESGEDAGFPGVQGRVAVTLPFVGDRATTLGVSGHWGREEYDLDAAGTNVEFDSWSINLDLAQPLGDKCTVKGEYFTGENLNTYFGGIGQGVNTVSQDEIRAKGGWIAASFGPWDNWSFNVGGGVDDVDDDDVADGARTRNAAVFGNVLCVVNKSTKVGFELSHWETDYKNDDDADALRGQLSFIYKF
jgi:hypothetical protein